MEHIETIKCEHIIKVNSVNCFLSKLNFEEGHVQVYNMQTLYKIISMNTKVGIIHIQRRSISLV